MAVDYGRSIGFEGDFYIEPKPKEPMKHQYDFDSATVIGFLRKYGLDMKLNIEANMDYDVSGGFLTYASSSELIQVNTSDTKKSMVTNLPTAIDGFGVSSAITAVYAGSNLQLRNFPTLTLNGTIRGVACGQSHCAALRTNELNGLDSIEVFNASAEAVVKYCKEHIQ